MDISSSRFVPKYWQLVEQFRKQIEIGILQPGDRLPSYTEMRSEFGASRPTTEKLHSILERDGLIIREPGRGTFVAQPKVHENRATIGFAGLSQNPNRHPHSLSILEGVHEVAQRENVDVLLLCGQTNVAWEKMDGVLICEAPPESQIEQLPAGMPTVVLLVPDEQMASVTADDQQGAFEATNHLLSLGHRKIGYLTAASDPLSIERIEGYQRALKAADVTFAPNWLHLLPDCSQSFVELGLSTMREWLGSGWSDSGCSALLAQNDEVAMGAIHAFKDAGLRVPEDVSVVGFDGCELGQFFTPSLTTMQVPLRDIACAGTELLLRQIKNEGVSAGNESIVMPSRLIVRESTGFVGV